MISRKPSVAAGGFFLAVQHNLNIRSEPDRPALDIFDSLDVLENFLGRFFGIRNSVDDNFSGHVVLLSWWIALLACCDFSTFGGKKVDADFTDLNLQCVTNSINLRLLKGIFSG